MTLRNFIIEIRCKQVQPKLSHSCVIYLYTLHAFRMEADSIYVQWLTVKISNKQTHFNMFSA